MTDNVTQIFHFKSTSIVQRLRLPPGKYLASTALIFLFEQKMSIQLKIWKRLTTKQAPLSSHHVSKAMSLLPPLSVYAKPHFKSPNFSTETSIQSISPPDRGVFTEFLLNKCSLTEEEIIKVFKQSNSLLRIKSTQNCEEVLELLNGCGLTTPAQIRKVTLRCPIVFCCGSETNLKSKFSFLRTFMKEKDIAKLIYTNARVITFSEDRLKSAVSLLRKLGFDSEAITELVRRQPLFLAAGEKDIMESFKIAEDFGFVKGSKTFSHALKAILGLGKEKLDRRLLCFSSLGFSEKQISEILRRSPMVLALSEENLKQKVDFLVDSVGIPLDDLVKVPVPFSLSLEKRLIPRFRVMKALESMQMLKKYKSFPSVFMLSERSFLEKYIHSHAESSSVLLDIYNGGKVEH